MARLALLVLLLANIGYFAWSQGWLRDFGLAPERQSEPQRIAQQIRPEALVVVSRESADADADAVAPVAPAVAPTSAPTAHEPAPAPAAAAVCLQAGLFDAAEAAALETALKRMLAEDRWRFEPVPPAARRLVLDGIDPALRERLRALEPALAGKPLEPCAADSAPMAKQ